MQRHSAPVSDTFSRGPVSHSVLTRPGEVSTRDPMVTRIPKSAQVNWAIHFIGLLSIRIKLGLLARPTFPNGSAEVSTRYPIMGENPKRHKRALYITIKKLSELNPCASQGNVVPYGVASWPMFAGIVQINDVKVQSYIKTDFRAILLRL